VTTEGGFTILVGAGMGPDAKVKLFTPAYRKIGTWTFSQVVEGQSLWIDLTSIPGGVPANGIYYVVLERGKKRLTWPLLIMK
jgi:hypothetical protein